MKRQLNPLSGKLGSDKRHAVFDIETNNWIEFEMAGFYDGRTYYHFDSISDLLDHCLHYRNRGRTIYAHNGGKFDFLFLLEEMRRRNLQCKIVQQGASAIQLKIEVKRKRTRNGETFEETHYTIKFSDSYAILRSSLKSLTESFNVKHKKLDEVIDFEKERVSKDNPKHREYLEYDCKGLWEVIQKFRETPIIQKTGLGLTIASTSMAAWRSGMKYPIRMTSNDVQNFCREAYAGGRVEIFNTTMKGGACGDVNSLYPYSMLKEMPVEYLRSASDPFEFGFHDVTVKVPDTYMPVLWSKRPKLVFPTGTFRGIYFSEELKLAVKHGAKILQFHEGHVFTKDKNLFTDFVNECYRMRLTGDPVMNQVGKALMNNCYGKFGQREERENLQVVDPNDKNTWPEGPFQAWRDEETFKKYGIIVIEKIHRSAHMLVHIAAAVTAYARIHMAENYYLKYMDKISYTDTDSIFINSDFATGNNLGELKREYYIKNGYFLLPKAYWIETDKGEIIKKIKGFSKKQMKSISYKDFTNKNIFATDNTILPLRESLIRGNGYLTTKERSKALRGTYDKRCVLRDGTTRPWHLKNGVLK